jgi:pimeloyl-ACP methyl ester carboxylesterase
MGRTAAGGRPGQGVWYAPDQPPKVALIATHYEVDFSEHYLAELMAQRGFGFLGWNTRYRGLAHFFTLEQALVDIGVGVAWLRKRGIDTVVLLGNSGGASLMGAYQSQATEPNITATAGSSLPAAVGSLPAADLFVSLNAHPGRPDVLTAWLDPAVTDETDPLSVDQSLDMFDPVHGPPYAADFVARYRSGQELRNQAITDWCKTELARLRAAGALDRAFSVYRTWADLRFLDLALDPSERSAGCYFGDPRVANYTPFGLAATNTLRSWLSMWSLSESQCRAEPHLARITQPAYVIQSTADQGCFPSDARIIFDALASTDKSLDFIPGDHYLQTPDGARASTADMIAEWVRRRV